MATKLFFSIVCTLLILNAIALNDHEHDDHGHDDDAFELSKEYFEEIEEEDHVEGNVTFDNVNLLVETILKRTNCSKRIGETDCNNCLNSANLFSVVDGNNDNELDEEEYERLSVVILNVISSTYEACVEGSTYDQHYASLVEGQTNGDLTFDRFDVIIANVTRIYDASIYYKCFEAEELFETVVGNHTVSADTHEVQELSAQVVYNVLKGYCIGEPTAVDPEWFIDDVFEHYADGDVISEEGFEQLLKDLEIGETTEEDHDDEEHNDDSHDGHDHRKRRNADDGHGHEDEDDHGHEDDHDEEHHCYSGEELLDIFNIDHEAGLHEDDLKEICPALLQQILTKSCQEEREETTKEEDDKEDKATIWGSGILAVLIISLASLCGVFVFPCIGKDIYHYVIQLLIALAVATLSGDAILHLVPQAFGLHAHGSDAHAHDDHSEEDHGPLSEELEYVWKGFALMGAIYVFFFVEKFMRLITKNGQSQGHHHHNHGEFPMNERKQNGDTQAIIEPPNVGICDRITSVAVMILVGDSVHNLADGLAIGAAFAKSSGAGISTSIAVLCHELPHEFGDFAVLLNSGLKFKEALLLNFLSALMAVVGLCIGIPVGENAEAREWIFTVVAGMFLYIALGDMLPELMHPTKVRRKWLVFLLQNIGFLIGLGIMLAIALYEDEISIEI